MLLVCQAFALSQKYHNRRVGTIREKIGRPKLENFWSREVWFRGRGRGQGQGGVEGVGGGW